MAVQYRPMYSIQEWYEDVGFSRKRAYDELQSDRIKTVYIGRRRFITGEAYADWVELLKTEAPEGETRAKARTRAQAEARANV